MSVSLSTFSQVESNLEKFEQSQNTPATPSPETPAVAIPEVPATPAEPVTPEPVVVPETPEVDNSSSNFSISLGDEPIVTPTPTPQQPATYNWKEEIKKLPKAELLKELGVNDFAIEMDNHISKGGKPVDYLSARAIDYNAISDESLIKDSLKKIYQGASQDQINLAFNRKYGVPDDATEEDKMFADLQLKSEANIIRQNAISEQSKYKVPEGIIPQDEAYNQWKEQQGKVAQSYQQLTDFYLNNPATKALHESKRVTISLGEGVKPYNWLIDKPELITNAFTDGGETWQKLTRTTTGEPDVSKQQLIALFAINPQKFMQDIFNYGKGMGVRKELVEEGQNAHRPQAKVINADPNAKPTYRTGTYAGGS